MCLLSSDKEWFSVSCHRCICLQKANKAIAVKGFIRVITMRPTNSVTVAGQTHGWQVLPAAHCSLVAIAGTLFWGFQKAGAGLDCEWLTACASNRSPRNPQFAQQSWGRPHDVQNVPSIDSRR